jgi:hypothetical protein
MEVDLGQLSLLHSSQNISPFGHSHRLTLCYLRSICLVFISKSSLCKRKHSWERQWETGLGSSSQNTTGTKDSLLQGNRRGTRAETVIALCKGGNGDREVKKVISSLRGNRPNLTSFPNLCLLQSKFKGTSRVCPPTLSGYVRSRQCFPKPFHNRAGVWLSGRALP